MPLLGPVAARSRSGWSTIRRTSSVSVAAAVVAVFSCWMVTTMSRSRASSAAVPVPVRWRRLTGPISLVAVVVWAGDGLGVGLLGRAGAGCGPRAGMGPGCDRTGRTVRAGTVAVCVGWAGEGDEGVAAGGEKSSDRPSTKANWRLSVRRARSRPCRWLMHCRCK